MTSVVVASAALNQTALDWEGNLARVRRAVAEAQGANFLCLPELCICGYGCEDAFFSEDVYRRSMDACIELAADKPEMVLLCGLPLLVEGKRFNAAAVIAGGEIKGIVPKQFLANYGVHYETRWFSNWLPGAKTELEINGKRVPVGDLSFGWGNINFGIEICHDAWVENRPGKSLTDRGCSLLFNLSASHFAFGKHQERVERVKLWSKNCTYVYSNLLGNEAGRVIYDGGTFIASDGEIIAGGPRFSFDEVQTIAAQIEVGVSKISADVKIAAELGEGVPKTLKVASWEESKHLKFEEFTRSVSLGLFDYLRKSRSKGFVVSMSGGADSAGTSLLVSSMIQLGIKELGEKAFIEKLSYIEGLDKKVCARLLTCVYQSTTNSSDVTRTAAREVTNALGASFYDYDVSDLVAGYVERISTALGHELTWDDHDIPLQNIQARTRSPGVWLIANVKGALLLSTSNRSEAAVGYTTMDGDTSGGLSPVAGIDKAFLREWLSWFEKTAPSGLEPISELGLVNSQAPTAELRPGNQSDEEDLMPYPVLDRIERYAIRDKLAPLEVYRALSDDKLNYSNSQLGAWVKRFFQLWARNQWKRERFAPSFHLDDENLDPKTWCRFPILSGGFA